MIQRGLVVPLTTDQIVTRALYLAGKRPLQALDEHVRKDHASLAEYGYPLVAGKATMCSDLYYLLHDHNGGKDPTAPDPGDRWHEPGSTFVNRTVDCSGGNAWVHGFDRYQPHRMRKSVGYDGWFNTDSKIIDATTPLRTGERRCFERVDRPEPGTIIVCKSGSYGHRIGHEGTVVAYHGLEWDPARFECWQLIDVVDCAARTPRRANWTTTGRGWYGTDALFLRCVMEP